MSILPNVKDSLLYKELEKENKFDFEIKYQKIIHNLDTVILSCCLIEDVKNFENWDNEEDKNAIEWKKRIKNLDDFLEKYSEEIVKEKVKFDNLYITKGYRMYRLNFNQPDIFDISFNTKKLPNSDTPRILIRISSTGLWNIGLEEVIKEMYLYLDLLLKYFNLGKTLEIKENRLDMAFHSNIIQNKEKYFSTENLAKIYKGTLTKGQNVFTIDTKNEEIDLQTLSLGSRKSNNIFFRVYDKTREVIELGKKDFFLDIWLENQLINTYDYYVLSQCYIHKSYEKRFEFMAEYYIRNSENKENIEIIEKELYRLRENNSTIEEFKKFILKYCPITTTILNYEFETHKKYYDTFKRIEELPIITDIKEIELLRIYRIFDNILLFIKPLLSKQVVFNCSFWEKFKSLKMKKLCNVKMKREYRKNKLNQKKTCLDVVGKVAKLSTMLNKLEKNSVSDDVSQTVDYIFNSCDIEFEFLQNKANKIRKRTLSDLLKKN